MNLYEVLIIAKQDIPLAEVHKVGELLTNVIEESEGRVLKSEYGDLQPLAYKIAKNQKGYYVVFGINLHRAKVAALAIKMRFNESIIRHRIFKIDAIDEEPSAFLSIAAAKAPAVAASTI